MLFRLENSEIFISIGKKISEARKSSRRKTNSIAKILNIPNQYLILIEKGKIEDIPNHIPTTSFIRTYAKFLDVDISDEWDEFKRSDNKSKKKKTNIKEKDPLPSKFLIFSISFLCLILVLYFFFNDRQGVDNDKEYGAGFNSEINEFEERTSVYIFQDSVEINNDLSKSEELNKESLENLIKLIFFEETWIQIYNQDNLLIYSGLFKIDETITLQVNNENINYFIDTGNLGGFNISFNGKVFSLLGQLGEVRKNISLLTFLEELRRT